MHWNFAHGALDSFVEVAGPGDVPSHGRQVAHERRRGLALLVLVLHVHELPAVVVEDDRKCIHPNICVYGLTYNVKWDYAIYMMQDT